MGTNLAWHGAPDSELDVEIRLHGVDGREQLNRLFEYDLLLSTSQPLSEADIDTLLSEPCAVSLSDQPGDVVHGLLSELCYVDMGGSSSFRYRARLVPTMWLLTLASTNRVYQGATTEALVKQVLGRYKLKDTGGGGEQADGDFRVVQTAAGKQHEYVVQYQESDWDFIQRRLESAGMLSWFEQHHDREELVIAEGTKHASSAMGDPVELHWRPRNGLSSGGVATVWDFDSRTVRTSARVVVQDYNYLKPTEALSVSARVHESGGFGTVYSFRDPFVSNEEGKEVAALRAERLASERTAVFGTSGSAALHAGHKFDVVGHPIDRMNGSYVVVEARHRAGCDVDVERDAAADEPGHRRVEFRAISAEVVYRPERRTPQPVIHGVMHAHIVGGDQPKRDAPKEAYIDGQGRYRVVLPFYQQLVKPADKDAEPVEDGADTSCWIRVAQASAGASYGIHHPLRQGTEVLIAHIDGNPDRPVIIGAVPNATTPSPTAESNRTQTIVETASGIGIEMEDAQV